MFGRRGCNRSWLGVLLPGLLLAAMAASGALAASPPAAPATMKMLPAEDYANVGISMALPQGFEPQTVIEPFDVLRWVFTESLKPTQAVTLCAYPIEDKVTADRFAEAMMTDLGKVLAITKLSVVKKSSMQVAQVEAYVLLLTYEFRGVASAAAKVFFIREEKVAQSPDKVRICYVLTAESIAERQGTLTSVLAEVVKTVKFSGIRQPIAMPHKDLTSPVRDYKMGYSFRPPSHWYVRLTPNGVESGLTDYVLGGIPMPMMRIVTEEPAQPATAEQAAMKMLDSLKQNALADGQDVEVVSQGSSKMGDQEAYQIVIKQAPSTRPARAKADEEPAVVIAQRSTGAVHEDNRPPRTYWLGVYCQATDTRAAEAILGRVAASFEVLPPATMPASATAPTSSPGAATASRSTSTSAPASRPAGGSTQDHAP